MKILLFAFLIILIGCNSEQADINVDSERKFISVAGINTEIKPGDNFFMHVNGIWYDSAKIADDQAGVGSYSFLNIPQKKLLENILEEVSTQSFPKGSIEQKVGDFYASGMDVTAINSRGFEPINPFLAQIEAITDRSGLTKFIASELKSSNQTLIGLGVSPDDENSSINIIHLSQTGLGLPDRDYYFKSDSSSVGIQNAYKTYLSTLFELTGSAKSEAQSAAEKVYTIEKQLAESHKTRIERRVVKENYHKLAVSAIEKKNKNLGLKSVLADLGLNADSVDVRQPAYYDRLNSMMASVSLADWKTYLKAHTLASYADILSTPFENAAFEYSKVVSGQSKQLTGAQQMVQKVDRQLGIDLGQLYVKRYFNEAAKQRVLDLVNNLQKSFENRIDQLDWMRDSTKAQAKEKLYAINKKIGYPDVWREYPVSISRDKYFENVLALKQDESRYQLVKFNKAPN